MNIVNKKIDELIPYENNPRKNDDAIEPVMKSIKEFGFKQPIVIDKNNIVIVGHTRLKASKELGMKQVPVIVADDLTTDQVKAYRLADNKTNEFAEWKFDTLLNELDEIDMDMEVFGFEDTEFNIDDIDEELLFDLYEKNENKHDKKNYLKWDNKEVELTEKDNEQMNKVYEQWLDNKTDTFVNYILNIND